MSSTIGHRRTLHARRAAVVIILLALAAGCGDDDKTTSPETTTTTTEKADTTTTADDTTSTTGEVDAAAVEAWNRDATEHRGQNGEKFTYECPGPGKVSDVWGVETYTDDSSVCTAAVQVGLITVAEGGSVEIEIAPGQDSYEAGVANGVTSTYYGTFQGSFTFPEAPPGSGTFEASPASWSRTAADRRGQNGKTFTLRCSANGTPASAWGTGTYTDDSSVCTAAVHSGLITVEDGGTVSFEIAPGQDSYEGSTANGVTTSNYAAFAGSFKFPTDQPSKSKS